jgi:hypothetical protein
MPRAKANADPVEEEYTSSAGRTYRLEAWRNGAFLIQFDGRTLVNRAPQIGAYFGAPRYPSNRLQQEALREAKVRAEGLRDDQH